MNWSTVGQWIKENAGTGATLVGSLLTGNVPGAVAAGVSMVAGATGTDDPAEALERLEADPATRVRLKEIAVENDISIRQHIETLERQRLEDAQAAHHETQETIRAGDQADDRLVRYTRPLQSWASLILAGWYVVATHDAANGTDSMILGVLLALPWSYAGLRQIGKGVNVLAGRRKRTG